MFRIILNLSSEQLTRTSECLLHFTESHTLKSSRSIENPDPKKSEQHLMRLVTEFAWWRLFMSFLDQGRSNPPMNIHQQVGEEIPLAIMEESWMIRVPVLSLCTLSVRQSLLGQLACMPHALGGDEDGGKLRPHTSLLVTESVCQML